MSTNRDPAMTAAEEAALRASLLEALALPMIPVLVWRDGPAEDATDGDQDNPCNRTYTVRAIGGGQLLAKGMTPERPRPNIGELVCPPGDGLGVLGLGYADAESKFHLWHASEQLAVATPHVARPATL